MVVLFTVFIVYELFSLIIEFIKRSNADVKRFIIQKSFKSENHMSDATHELTQGWRYS